MRREMIGLIKCLRIKTSINLTRKVFRATTQTKTTRLALMTKEKSILTCFSGYSPFEHGK